ncbi:hypothetical protein [Methylobacterium sp. WL69]|nr:hypothetical protein [Methylobacterium sp. WL69]
MASVLRIVVDDDAHAMEAAKAMVDDHAVELWDGLRLIEHFPAID